MNIRRMLYEYLLEPGTGKAVPVLRGQVLRVQQLGDGQCADFNGFNLHNYKEHFHAGRTRVIHGLFPTTGDMLWSSPPRERPMYTIISDTVGTNDVNYPRCTSVFYESKFGFLKHTNCHDIQVEAQREYGLTADDVHDSFNMSMNTAVTPEGRMYVKPQRARRGDYIELFAHFDTLAVVNVCGSDVTWTSNFELKSLLVQVWGLEEGERDRWLLPERRYGNQVLPADIPDEHIEVTRRLARNPMYVPNWPVYPVQLQEIAIDLTAEELKVLAAIQEKNPDFGADAGQVLRSVFFVWWSENRMPE